MAATAPLALPSAGRGRASELVDALPYIDPLTDAEKARVDALVADEAGRQGSKTPDDYLRELLAAAPPPESPFVKGHPLVLREYERVAAGEPMPALDPSRYRLDPPPESQRADPLAWLAALRNARAQLQHQQGRTLNLELLSRPCGGAAAWRAHAGAQAASARALAAEASPAAEAVVALNRRRKLQQLAAGKELREVEEDWARALAGVGEVGAACAALEREVEELAGRARAGGREKEAERAEEALEEARRIGGEGDGVAGAVAAAAGEEVVAMEEDGGKR